MMNRLRNLRGKIIPFICLLHTCTLSFGMQSSSGAVLVVGAAAAGSQPAPLLESDDGWTAYIALRELEPAKCGVYRHIYDALTSFNFNPRDFQAVLVDGKSLLVNIDHENHIIYVGSKIFKESERAVIFLAYEIAAFIFIKSDKKLMNRLALLYPDSEGQIRWMCEALSARLAVKSLLDKQKYNVVLSVVVDLAKQVSLNNKPRNFILFKMYENLIRYLGKIGYRCKFDSNRDEGKTIFYLRKGQGYFAKIESEFFVVPNVAIFRAQQPNTVGAVSTGASAAIAARNLPITPLHVCDKVPIASPLTPIPEEPSSTSSSGLRSVADKLGEPRPAAEMSGTPQSCRAAQAQQKQLGPVVRESPGHQASAAMPAPMAYWVERNRSTMRPRLPQQQLLVRTRRVADGAPGAAAAAQSAVGVASVASGVQLLVGRNS